MTSVFMVLEVSGNYSIILPVMISNTIAYLISLKYQRVPIFDLLSKQDGLDLPSLEEVREEDPLRVEDAMRSAGVPPQRSDRSVAQVRTDWERNANEWVLLHDKLSGWHMMRRAELLEKIAGARNDAKLADVAPWHPVPVVYPDNTLDTPLRKIDGLPFIPVVHRANPGRLVGIITREDILQAYTREGEQEIGVASPS